MHGRICSITLALIAGCTDVPESTLRVTKSREDSLGQSFDASTTGTIQGSVTWEGEVPTTVEQSVRAHASNPYLNRNPAHFTMPHYPKVHVKTNGVKHAVVFLRKVEPTKSKPWDLARVRVKIEDRKMIVSQGVRRSSVGFVRRGDAIELANRDVEYHNLVARGSAFFAEPLIEKDRVSKRTLSKTGIVELGSGNAYFWLHAHLFVTDHPYYASTDDEGRFTLTQVPAGKYELVCWLPSWHIRRREHDPETGTLARVQWASPVEQTRSIDVQAQRVGEVQFQWSAKRFPNDE